MILRVKTTAIVTLEKCTQQLVLHSDAASSLQRRFTSSPPRDEPLGKSHRKSAWQWRHDDDFHSKLHNYIITINKLDTVWLTCGDGGCFLGESSLKSRQEDWRSRWFIIKVSCQWQMLFFGQKCAEEQDGRFSRCDCDISFLKCPKTVTVFMLLLFGPVTLLCGTFLWRRIPACKQQCEWGSLHWCAVRTWGSSQLIQCGPESAEAPRPWIHPSDFMLINQVSDQVAMTISERKKLLETMRSKVTRRHLKLQVTHTWSVKQWKV